jgi:hypothetical protein
MSSGTVIVGAAGGIAESVACLTGACTVVLDRKPSSPDLLEAVRLDKVKVYFGELADGKRLEGLGSANEGAELSQLTRGAVVVACADEGAEDLREDSDSQIAGNDALLGAARAVSAGGAKAVLCAVPVVPPAVEGLGALFLRDGAPELTKACEERGLPCHTLRFGDLQGGIPGRAPLPFKSMPLREPELEASLANQAVVLSTAANAYAEGELCVRPTLAAALARVARDLASGSLDLEVCRS